LALFISREKNTDDMAEQETYARFSFETAAGAHRPAFCRRGVDGLQDAAPTQQTRPRRAPELLPIQETNPAWDGSYPYLVIRPNPAGHGRYRFQSSVARIQPTVRHELPVNEFQVDLHSGMFILRQTDLFVADSMPLVLTRTYLPWSYYARAFGVGTNHPYDICPTGTRFPYTYMDLNLEDERRIHFPRISKGTDYSDAVYRHDRTSSEFYGAQIAWNGDGWTLDFRDGRRFLFPEAYNSKTFAQGAPTEMRGADGNRIQLKRDKVRNLETLVSPLGHTIAFKYDGANHITEAADDAGNTRKYSYDATGHLATVSDDKHVLYRFQYEALLRARGYDPYLLTAVEDGEGRTLVRNLFNDRGLVSTQALADGEVIQYDYLYDRKGSIAETIVRRPNMKAQRFFFLNGIPISEK
jgi:YD repeat-containing protein